MLPKVAAAVLSASLVLAPTLAVASSGIGDVPSDVVVSSPVAFPALSVKLNSPAAIDFATLFSAVSPSVIS